jgi:RNA polymerase sigma-70 factor (ECF subfamily)
MLARSITHRWDLAEDAIQEAVTQLWTASCQPKGDPIAYFFAAVRNAATKQRDRGRVLGRVSPVADDDDPGLVALSEESRACVRRALFALPIQYREVVFLHLFTGLTFQQVAMALEKPLGTVTSYYRRALCRLAQMIEE